MGGQLLLLASRSERRRRLLREAGVRFVVVEPGDESAAAAWSEPRALAIDRARVKARRCRPAALDGLVLGVDTVVADARGVLDKPPDAERARATLRRLSGSEHEVWTAHCFLALRHGRVDPAHERVEVTHARVRVARLDERAIDRYLESEEWRGKAGGYAVQGIAGGFLEIVDGSRPTVIGIEPSVVVAALASPP